MNLHGTINYLEFPAHNLGKTKQFFQSVFNWEFTDYGPEYTAFKTPTLEGGFYQSNLYACTDQGSAFVVFYSQNLEETRDKIIEQGGEIKKPIFPFPGGRRFHFTEPSGNEFAVWSEK